MSADIPDYNWTDISRDKRRFDFQENPGVNIHPDDPISPLEFLKTIITDELVESIVNFTNKYAEIVVNDPDIQARVAGKHCSVYHLWKNTNKDEMWLYFAVCLIMGIVQKPEYPMYWTKQHTFSTPIFSRLMRRDRFEQLRKMIHFSDPENEENQWIASENYVSSWNILLHDINKITHRKSIWRLMNIYHFGKAVSVFVYIFRQSEKDTESKYLCSVKVEQDIC